MPPQKIIGILRKGNPTAFKKIGDAVNTSFGSPYLEKSTSVGSENREVN